MPSKNCGKHLTRLYEDPIIPKHINNIQQKIADVKKTTTIQVFDITKENRTDKIEMLKKCLNKEPFEKIIADDNDFKLSNVILELKGLTPDKIEKAIRTMSFSLDVPLKAAKGEVFLYQAQEDLTTRWSSNFSQMTRSIYDLVINYFGLPEVTVMAKAEEYLRYQGKVLYSPETGEPIPQKKWDQFVKTLEDFLNRKVKDTDKKIILESKSLGIILDRMLKYNTLEAGSTGKSGWGLNHIIEQRSKKDNKSAEEIAAMLPLVIDTVANGNVKRDVSIIKDNADIATLTIEKNGIVAFVGKSKNGMVDKFVITGFEDKNKTKEATDAINTVIAEYSYTPEFVIVKNQVGAVIASLNKVSDKKIKSQCC